MEGFATWNIFTAILACHFGTKSFLAGKIFLPETMDCRCGLPKWQ
jgi:hypothetical protein